jgi:hypothetical protein
MSKIKDKIDEALFAGDPNKLADILKGLQNDCEWLNPNEGLEKFIETLEKE